LFFKKNISGQFNSVEVVFSYADFSLDVLYNEMLNLQIGVYFIDLYTGDRKLGSLRPLYIDCKCEERYKEIIFGLYNNILSVISYMNINTDLDDNRFRLVIYKDLFKRSS
jgi:hypothetical protein